MALQKSIRTGREGEAPPDYREASAAHAQAPFQERSKQGLGRGSIADMRKRSKRQPKTVLRVYSLRKLPSHTGIPVRPALVLPKGILYCRTPCRGTLTWSLRMPIPASSNDHEASFSLVLASMCSKMAAVYPRHICRHVSHLASQATESRYNILGVLLGTAARSPELKPFGLRCYVELTR